MKLHQFILFRGNHELFWRADSEDGTGEFERDISLCFATSLDPLNRQIAISCRQTSSAALRKRIETFVEIYKGADPKINKIKSFVEKIPDGEHFFYMPCKSKLTNQEKVLMTVELMAADAGQNVDKALIAFDKNMGYFFEHYELDGKIPEKKTWIGERSKKKRICRFCKNTRVHPQSDPTQEAKTTFKQEAHAISEALGNKTLILHEECDACNKYFSETCERHIYTYLRCLGTFFKVKNKDNKVSSIKGENFQITYLSKDRKEKILAAVNAPSTDASETIGLDPHELSRQILALDFAISYTLPEGEEAPQDRPPTSIPLKFKEKLSPQEVYKALVKFALSVIETENLAGFEKALEWVSGSRKVTALPKIAILRSYASFSKAAELIIYRRISNDKTLPLAIGELQFTFQKMIFIIPSFDEAEASFITDEEFKHYWDFCLFNAVQGWSFQDFSDPEEKEFIFNMNLSENKSAHQEEADTFQTIKS